MGWINYTSGGGNAGVSRLEAFAAAGAHQKAVVVVSENDVARCAVNYEAYKRFVRIDAVEHMKVTEYRGLTKATAEYLADGVAGNRKIMLKFSYYGPTLEDLHTMNLPALIGTEYQCAISRANEADGYVLTVTESTTNWAAPVSGHYVSYGGVGTSFGTIKQGDVYIKYGALA